MRSVVRSLVGGRYVAVGVVVWVLEKQKGAVS